MKKISIVMILVTMAGAGLFAAGNQEAPAQAWGRGAGMYQQSADFSGEEIEVTGRLELKENDFPELISGSETYELGYRFADFSGLDISSGDVITVKGILTPGPRWEEDGDENHLMLTSAVIDGKEYDLSEYSGYGAGGMMKGSRGRGRSPMMGMQPRW